MTISQEIWQISHALSEQAAQGKRGGAVEERRRRWATLFAERYGVEGEECATLNSVGERHKLTRERVRQITSKVLQHSAAVNIPTPCLDQLREQIEKHTPAPIESINDALRSLLGPKLSVRDAQRFASEVLGRKVANLIASPFQPLTASKRVAIAPKDSDDQRTQARAVRSCALKMIRSTGAAQIHFLAGMAGEYLDQALDTRLVTRWCTMTPNFEWLDQSAGWFWLGPTTENRLFTVVRKQLAATGGGRLDISDVHAGMNSSVRNLYRAGEKETNLVEAPAAVLARALARTPWLKIVQHNDVMLAPGQPVPDALSSVESAIIEFLRTNNGVAWKHEIARHVVDHKIATQMGIAMALMKSPVVTKLGHGLYTVRGTTISPVGLSEAHRRGRSGSNASAELLPDGNTYRWSVRITEGSLRNRHRVHLPVALATVIPPGTYRMEEQGSEIRVVIPEDVTNAYVGGLAGALIKQGYKASETISLLIDIEQKTVRRDQPPLS
ncbi:MAG: hypothetical protein K2X75_02285 [Burkholderiaceae bacterium]|nr:hypothetical protein [Burkholderiaceae bacterium]